MHDRSRSHAQALAEGLGSCGLDHELLDGQLVSGVFSPVEDIKGGDRKGDGVHPPRYL